MAGVLRRFGHGTEANLAVLATGRRILQPGNPRRSGPRDPGQDHQDPYYSKHPIDLTKVLRKRKCKKPAV